MLQKNHLKQANKAMHKILYWIGGGTPKSILQRSHQRISLGLAVLLAILLVFFFTTIEFIDHFANLAFEADMGTKTGNVSGADTNDREAMLGDFSSNQFLARFSVAVGVLSGLILSTILLLGIRGLLAQENLYQKFERFLWWCAGARIDFLELSASDHSKYFGIGGTVLFTALMATFAGGYAFFVAFDHPLLSICFGFFWGTLIFNLDRFIVSSTGKGDGTPKITKEEFLTALPRLILAILIAIVVSTPLELRVFKKEISIEIQKMIDEKRQELAQGQDYNLVEIQRIKNEISRLKSQLEESKISITDDPRVDLANSKIGESQTRVDELRTQLSRAESTIQTYQQEISRMDDQLRGDNLSSTQRQDIQSRKNRRLQSIGSQENKVQRLQQEVLALEQTIDSSKTKIDNVKGENADSYGVKLSQTRNEIERLEEQLANIQGVRRSEIERYEDIAKQYTGLMAQLDALSRLTKRPVYEKEFFETSTSQTPTRKVGEDSPASLSLVSDATLDTATLSSAPNTKYKQIGTELTPVFYAKWFISLLFICIEIAPIFFKMMTASGPYDDLIDLEQAIISKKIEQSKSEQDKYVATEISIYSQKLKEKEEKEVQANKEILDAILASQVKIALTAVEDWKERQMDQVQSNPEAFIKSTAFDPNASPKYSSNGVETSE